MSCFCRVSRDFFYSPPSWYKNTKGNQFPLKISSISAGFNLFQVNLETAWDNYRYLYNGKNLFQPLETFRLIIHSPEELPVRIGHHFFHGKFDRAYYKVVTELKNIDRTLESWTPQKRHCFIDGEKKLIFFKIYTKANCENECLSRAALEKCGCVPFYMIRKFAVGSIRFLTLKLPGSPHDRICGVFDRNCYSLIERDFDVSSNCQCFDRCGSVRYSTSSLLMQKRFLNIFYEYFLV